MKRRPAWLASLGPVVVSLVACATPATNIPPTSASSSALAPRFAASGPAAEEYIVGAYSHMDEIFEGRVVRRAATPSALARVPEPAITWRLQEQTYALDDYLARNPTTGLLIARGDTIFVERYQYARTDTQRFTSWSMAKTVTSMLIGIAIEDGRIRSVDEPAAAYVAGLAGTEYGKTSIRHLLQMSSGVRFSEAYSVRDDVTRLSVDTFVQRGAGDVSAVTPFNERVVPAGTKFSYASSETQVLGLVLRAAIGRPLAEYLQEKIWQPIGAEADATWLIDRSGQEVTFCCLNAVLRDYARLGLLLAHDGNWRGWQLIPAG